MPKVQVLNGRPFTPYGANESKPFSVSNLIIGRTMPQLVKTLLKHGINIKRRDHFFNDSVELRFSSKNDRWFMINLQSYGPNQCHFKMREIGDPGHGRKLDDIDTYIKLDEDRGPKAEDPQLVRALQEAIEDLTNEKFPKVTTPPERSRGVGEALVLV